MKLAALLIVCNSDRYLNDWLDQARWFDYVGIAEGATARWCTALGWDNHRSKDKTNEILDSRNYPVYRHDKLYVDKCEQQNYALSLLPDDTDYVWIIDSDEFYHPEYIEQMRYWLANNEPMNLALKQYNFFKSTKYIGVGGDGYAYSTPQNRIFKYAKGCKFSNHRPITLCVNDKPIIETFKVPGSIDCYHYSYIDERQVYEKMLYYSEVFRRDYINDWFNPVWKEWNEGNRYQIELNHSIHPSCPNAKTEKLELYHPI